MKERRAGTYKMPADGYGHQDHCEAQPDQKLPAMKGSGNTRKEYGAEQGPRSDGFDASPRKPGQ